MHLATLIAISLPFLPSIISHPVVDGAEAPSRVIQRRQYDTLTADATATGDSIATATGDSIATATGDTLPTGTGEVNPTGTGEVNPIGTSDPFATGTGDPVPTSTRTSSLGQKNSLKYTDNGGLLAACASASLGLTGSTATASAGLTGPTGTTEKREVEKRQAWHAHMAKLSPQDFAKLCAMVEEYSTTGENTALLGPTGTASATLPTSTTELSEDKKMRRANGW